MPLTPNERRVLAAVARRYPAGNADTFCAGTCPFTDDIDTSDYKQFSARIILAREGGFLPALLRES